MVIIYSYIYIFYWKGRRHFQLPDPTVYLRKTKKNLSEQNHIQNIALKWTVRFMTANRPCFVHQRSSAKDPQQNFSSLHSPALDLWLFGLLAFQLLYTISPLHLQTDQKDALNVTTINEPVRTTIVYGK